MSTIEITLPNKALSGPASFLTCCTQSCSVQTHGRSLLALFQCICLQVRHMTCKLTAVQCIHVHTYNSQLYPRPSKGNRSTVLSTHYTSTVCAVLSGLTCLLHTEARHTGCDRHFQCNVRITTESQHLRVMKKRTHIHASGHK